MLGKKKEVEGLLVGRGVAGVGEAQRKGGSHAGG